MEHNFEPTAGIAALIRTKYPSLRFCVWSTRLLEEFLPHPLPSYFEVVEIERKYKEEVFRFLAGKVQHCIREEDFKRVRSSLPGLWPIVLVRNLISEAPLIALSGISAPTPEKLIVDIYCDNGIFNFIGDNSLEDVFVRFCERSPLDQRSLGRYAARRGRRASLWQYLAIISGKQFK